jgi:hypothetical protein
MLHEFAAEVERLAPYRDDHRAGGGVYHDFPLSRA